MIKFEEIINTKISKCKKCFALVYTLPCYIDNSIEKFLTYFGRPVYSLKATSLMRINMKDGFYIESRIGSKIIKFSMPKHMEDTNIALIDQKIKFDSCLVLWMRDKLELDIV